MSSAESFKGSIKVVGFSKRRNPLLPDTVIFNETCDVQGSTIGELLDRIVQSSVILANSAFSWAITNETSSYVPTKDKWKVELSFPEIIGNKGKECSESRITCQGTLINFESIVKYAVRLRKEQITQAAFNLILAKIDEPSLIVDELRFAVENSNNAPAGSFHQLAYSGCTGVELDRILAIAELEGRITEYSMQIALMDSFPKREFLPQDKFRENVFI